MACASHPLFDVVEMTDIKREEAEDHMSRWSELEYQREQQRKHAHIARCQWIVETCASLPWARHVKPCGEPATVCTLNGDIVHETFCNEHGAEKEKQGVAIFIISTASWFGDAPWKRGTFTGLHGKELAQ